MTMSDYTPYSQAFCELSSFYFIELQDHAASYMDSFVRADLIDMATIGPPKHGPTDAEEDEDDADDTPDDEDTGGDSSEAEAEDTDDSDVNAETPAMSAGERWFRQAMAVGFVLKRKTEGWKLFCERLNIPPFLLWQEFPGFQRLQIALDLTEKAAFVQRGFVR